MMLGLNALPLGRPTSRYFPAHAPRYSPDAVRERAVQAVVVVAVVVTSKGAVDVEAKRRAVTRLSQLDRLTPGPLLGVRVMLRLDANPSLERPARAEAELNVNGHLVCARGAEPQMRSAVDVVADRLERQLKAFDRRRRRQRRASHALPVGEWRHGAYSPARPSHFPRPAQERQIMRRKTFALEPLEPAHAVEQMLDLDHDFYLFTEAASGADAVVYRREDGGIGLIEQPSAPTIEEPVQEISRERSRYSQPISLETAIAEMNMLEHKFMFFCDDATGRGNVMYMRYDGHYGLIEAA